jgi:hypothetical protein
MTPYSIPLCTILTKWPAPFWPQCNRDQVKIRSALRREHLRQMSDAQQFQHARCHVGEFKDA